MFSLMPKSDWLNILKLLTIKLQQPSKKFDDFNTGGNLIVTDRFAIQNNWIPIKKFDTSISLTSSSG